MHLKIEMDGKTAQIIKQVYRVDPASVICFIHYASANGRYWPNTYVPTPHLRPDGVPWGIVVAKDGRCVAVGFTQGIDSEGVTHTSRKLQKLGLHVTEATIRYVKKHGFCPGNPSEYYAGDPEGLASYQERIRLLQND